MMDVPAQVLRLADGVACALSAQGALAQQVKSALGASIADNAWLPSERRRASHDRYARHLLYADPQGRFSVVAIVWDHGQCSPIHGHHVWCAVGVYQGTLTETYYREQPAGTALETGSAVRTAGSLSFDLPHASVHRIANESGTTAISLHVYGAGRDEIGSGVNRIL
jgi:predicted metal-dependent enzyme (double-stranded beta helix superfamily)